MSVCNISSVELLVFLYGVYGGVCGESEFMQRLSDALHGTFDSYLRDALQEGSDAVACLPVPRAKVFTTSFFLFAWWPPLLFLVRIYFVFTFI
jgi:hypothetical protein